MVREKSYQFDEGTRIAINEHIDRIFKPWEQEESRNMSQSEFVELCEKVCGIVKNTPIVAKFIAMFKNRERGVSIG